jgi:hypothetical protein
MLTAVSMPINKTLKTLRKTIKNKLIMHEEIVQMHEA